MYLTNDVYKLDEEISRLMDQNRLLEEYEQPVYDRAFQKKQNVSVLDIGCNNGMKTIDRFKRNEISCVIGLEYHEELAAFANREYGGGKYRFYHADAESPQFEKILGNIMAENGLKAFDVINISFVLMHLKNPGELLRCLRNFLKKDGMLIIVDADDRFSVMEPDDNRTMELFLKLCFEDELSGFRHFGGEVPGILASCGYHNIVTHSKCVSANASEFEKKDLIFKTFFSYIPKDYESLYEEKPENPEYAQIKQVIRKYYGLFREDFVEKASYVACGVVIATCCR